jgi:hypothetical protein
VRTAIVTGAACASRVWGAPGSPRPRCDASARRLVCR